MPPPAQTIELTHHRHWLFQEPSIGQSEAIGTSSHVTRGRRNLAFQPIYLLRRVGMSAFQNSLAPNNRSTRDPTTESSSRDGDLRCPLDVPAELRDCSKSFSQLWPPAMDIEYISRQSSST